MNYKRLKQSFFRKKELILSIVAITTIFGLYINFFLPHRFKAEVQILISQKDIGQIDAYTSIRGAEQIANTLKYILYSPSFLDQVLAQGQNIEKDYFALEREKKAKQWKRMVQTTPTPNTGILEVEIFHPDPEQAQNLARGVLATLSQEDRNYFGARDNIQITTLSEPIVSQRYAKPNALVNTGLGFVLGILISFGLVYFFPKKKIGLDVLKFSSEKPDYSIPQNLPIDS